MPPLSPYERSLLFLVLPPHRNCWVFLLIATLASSNSRGEKNSPLSALWTSLPGGAFCYRLQTPRRHILMVFGYSFFPIQSSVGI